MKIIQAEFIKSCVDASGCPPENDPEIALAGRSNVGKSSLLNALLKERGLAKVSGVPGKTRMINFFGVTIDGPRPMTFVLADLPGYGYARVPKTEKASWGRLIENYLAHRSTLRGLVVLLDIRHPPSHLDRQLLTWLDRFNIPSILVATKSDQMPRGQRNRAVQAIREDLPSGNAAGPILPFSSKSGEGREALLSEILRMIRDPGP